MNEENISNAVAEIENKPVLVTTPEQKNEALTICIAIKTRKSEVVEFFRDNKAKAHATWKGIVAQEKSFTDRLDAAEREIKTAVMGYDREQEKIRLAEQRRIQAVADEQARKEREKQEQAAARQRAIEAEARQKADAARRAAEQASADERARLLKEAEAADRKANAAAIKVEAKEEQAAAVVAPVVHVAPVAPATSGVSTVKRWKARVTDMDKVPRQFLLPNQTALDAYARAVKGAMPVPGVEFYQEESMSVRTK